MPKKDISTDEQLRRLTQEIKKLNSFKRRFLLGLTNGVGTAIGATIIASLAVFLLSRFIRSVEDVPILNDLITRLELMQLLN